MIYFIHDETNRSIKIGHAINPRTRLSQLQISTPNKLVLLGAIAGTKRIEKKVHALVRRHRAPKPGESFERPLWIHGEWFNDRILPFAQELMRSPKQFLEADKKPAKPRPGKDASLHQGTISLVFDSGEAYQEHFVPRAGSPQLALAALEEIARARLPFLAHTARVAGLTVAGCPGKDVAWQGGFVTQRCEPRDGVSVIFTSEPGGCRTINGVKQYSQRWLHGVPDELWDTSRPWNPRPVERFTALVDHFARVLQRHQSVISSSLPLVVRGVILRNFWTLLAEATPPPASQPPLSCAVGGPRSSPLGLGT